jgi:hypothetical protein
MTPEIASNPMPDNSRSPAEVVDTVSELIRMGGPLALIEQAKRRAGELEGRFWLGVLESLEIDDDGGIRHIIVPRWIKELRRRLGVAPSRTEVRAQTRERVRRFRCRKARALLKRAGGATTEVVGTIERRPR